MMKTNEFLCSYTFSVDCCGRMSEPMFNVMKGEPEKGAVLQPVGASSAALALRSFRMILPVMVIGSSSTNSISLGYS